MTDFFYERILAQPETSEPNPLGYLVFAITGANFRISFDSLKTSFFNNSNLTGAPTCTSPPAGIPSSRVVNASWVLNELGSLGLTAATNTTYGTVRTDGVSTTPTVYLKEQIDNFNTVPRPVATGGTGANNDVTARTNLNAAKSGNNADITALTALASVPAIVQAAINALIPPGGCISFAGSPGSIPSGWGMFDGRAISRADNPVLFGRFGTTYGSGNGTTTFNLPNWIDRFPVIAGGTSDLANTVNFADLGGANQFVLATNQLASHSHAVTVNNGGIHSHTATMTVDPGHVHAGATDGQGSHAHNLQLNNPNNAPSTGGTAKLTPGSGVNVSTDQAGFHAHNISTTQNGSHAHSFTINNSSDHSHTASSAVAGSNTPIDNRPRYVGLLMIVRLG
jgi:microcystin-dependent protein